MLEHILAYQFYYQFSKTELLRETKFRNNKKANVIIIM